MTRKRFVKLLRARVVNHSLKYGYKADYKLLQKIPKQGHQLVDNYSVAWSAIDKALHL